MAHVMTRRGEHDNVVAYEHMCDTRADLANIPPDQITLGSVAVVLRGEVGLEVYMADSNKVWVSLFETAPTIEDTESTGQEEVGGSY